MVGTPSLSDEVRLLTLNFIRPLKLASISHDVHVCCITCLDVLRGQSSQQWTSTIGCRLLMSMNFSYVFDPWKYLRTFFKQTVEIHLIYGLCDY